MSDFLFGRGLFAVMAAAMIIPEPATFVIVVGFCFGLIALAGQFAWALVRDFDAGSDEVPPADSAAIISERASS